MRISSENTNEDVRYFLYAIIYIEPLKLYIMKKIKMNRHHRRAKFYGIDNSDRNVVIVEQERHRAFHNLFSIKSPFYIVKRLQRILGIKLRLICHNPDALLLYKNEQKAGVCRKKKVIEKSKHILFDGLTVQGILSDINRTWIDPDFQIMRV